MNDIYVDGHYSPDFSTVSGQCTAMSERVERWAHLAQSRPLAGDHWWLNLWSKVGQTVTRKYEDDGKRYTLTIEPANMSMTMEIAAHGHVSDTEIEVLHSGLIDHFNEKKVA